MSAAIRRRRGATFADPLDAIGARFATRREIAGHDPLQPRRARGFVGPWAGRGRRPQRGPALIFAARSPLPSRQEWRRPAPRETARRSDRGLSAAAPVAGVRGVSHVRLWRFVVPADREARFIAAYGPQGDWARLFREAARLLAGRAVARRGRQLPDRGPLAEQRRLRSLPGQVWARATMRSTPSSKGWRARKSSSARSTRPSRGRALPSGK